MYISCCISRFIPCHRKYSQSGYRKAVVYSTVFNPTFPSCTAILFSTKFVSVFSMAWYKIVTQHFLVVYYGISHLSLVFSSYTHSPKGSCAYWEKSSHSWDISRYTTPKHCITSIYLIRRIAFLSFRRPKNVIEETTNWKRLRGLLNEYFFQVIKGKGLKGRNCNFSVYFYI